MWKDVRRRGRYTAGAITGVVGIFNNATASAGEIGEKSIGEVGDKGLIGEDMLL